MSERQPGPGSTVRIVHASSPISALVMRPAVTIAGSATLGEAVDRMTAAGVSSVLLEERSGILTERDVTRALGAGLGRDDPAEAAATPHPIVVDGSMAILDACGFMLNEHLRHLLVALPDRSVGVVSLRDVTAVLLQVADPQLWLTTLRVTLESPSEIWLG